MKKLFILLSALLTTMAFTGTTSAANKDDITAPVKAYFRALNASDKDGVMAQYSRNPVFMQQGAPAFVGRATVSQAYDHIFTALDLNVELEILEAEQMSPTMAMIRTHSKGTIHIIPENRSSEEGNNELFIVKLEDKKWKIYHYIFSSDKM
jgi:ketosteroid isomerase-like protein